MSKISKIQARLATPSEERELNASATPKGVDSPLPPVSQTTSPNTFWDDAEKMFTDSMLAIEATHGQLAEHLTQLMSDDGAYAKITDGEGLLSNVRLLGQDINVHISRLNAIHAKHAGRTGGTITPDDNMHVIQINGMYYDALEIYNNTIMPTVSHIFEQIGAAELLLQAELEQQLADNAAKAQDPSYVTDVVVKDASNDASAPQPAEQSHS